MASAARKKTSTDSFAMVGVNQNGELIYDPKPTIDLLDDGVTRKAITVFEQFTAGVVKKQVDQLAANPATKGDKGDTGTTGAKGDKGDTGAVGAKGDKGDTGAAGANGDTGAAGVAGAKGDKGDTGAAGVAGTKGDKGDTGAAGATNPATVAALGGVYIPNTGGLYVGADGKLGVDFELFGKPVKGRTKADIQAAINASTTAGERILLFGEYDFSANPNDPLILNKNVELIGMNNCVFNGGNASGYLMKVNKITKGAAVRNIKFTSQSTTSPVALIYCNEEGDINNLTFDTCQFIGNPLGNYNAFGMNAYAGNTSTGATFNNITFYNCTASAGRMGWEVLNHDWANVTPRITNFYFVNCTVNGAGTANVNNADLYGMGLSLSGPIYGVTITSPVFVNTLLGLELIGTRRFAVSNPRIYSSRTAVSADNVSRPSNGISITNGGNAGKEPNEGSITGGIINVTGRVINTYYANDISVTGGNHIGGQYAQFQHGVGLRLHSVDLECLGSHHIAAFEDQKEVYIDGGKWSRKNATKTPIYQPVSFDGACDGIVRGLDIRTNKSIRDGQADNAFDAATYQKSYIYSDSTTVYWMGLFWNGKKQEDKIA